MIRHLRSSFDYIGKFSFDSIFPVCSLQWRSLIS